MTALSMLNRAEAGTPCKLSRTRNIITGRRCFEQVLYIGKRGVYFYFFDGSVFRLSSGIISGSDTPIRISFSHLKRDENRIARLIDEYEKVKGEIAV